MKKTQFIITVVISVIAVVTILSARYYFSAPYVGNYKDATFTLDGQPITMTSPGIKYFGNEAVGDFNGDQQADVAFLFTSEPGGSGTFFYAVAALGSINSGFTGTNAILLGDRIAPQTTEFRDGQIIVNFADRWFGQQFTTQPSRGVSKYFSILNNTLTESEK